MAEHIDQGRRNQDGNIIIFSHMEKALEKQEEKWSRHVNGNQEKIGLGSWILELILV